MAKAQGMKPCKYTVYYVLRSSDEVAPSTKFHIGQYIHLMSLTTMLLLAKGSKAHEADQPLSHAACSPLRTLALYQCTCML